MSIFDELGSYLRRPYYNPLFSSRHSGHEAVKSQLYVLAFKLGYRPVLEAMVSGSPRNGRIDCVFMDTVANRIVCAFEIDGSVREKSLVKLLSLGADVEKIVISFGSPDSWRKMVNRIGSSAGFGDIRFFRLRTLNEVGGVD